MSDFDELPRRILKNYLNQRGWDVIGLSRKERKMDLRLDFYQYIKDFASKITDDDAFLVITHNKKDGDCILSMAGDWEILSSLFSTDDYVNHEDQEVYENIRSLIINTAYNICRTDDKVRDRLMEGIRKLKNEENRTIQPDI